MADDVECPYCGEWQEICHDDGYGYSEDQKFRQQCADCDKVFSFMTSISFYYEAEVADCLNGGEHEWKPAFTMPVEYTKMECTACGERREPTPEELRQVKQEREAAYG